MVTVEEVKTARQRRQFLNFPLKLYKGNPYFVPPLYGDEKKIFRKDYLYHDTCEDSFFLAYRDGTVVGRISGILQKASNEKRNEKRVRFTRFDSIDDGEVASALFSAVEDWGRKKGMDTICGPLGYSDQEREGLLIEGFDELSTFEEQYNYDYYQRLIENCGYAKEVDWLERKIYPPEQLDEKFKQLSEFMLRRYKLHVPEMKNTKEFIAHYKDQIFELLDTTYADLYGTVPFTEGVKKLLIDNFKLIIDIKYTAVIVDENDRVVCFGLMMPSLAKAVQKSGGKLTPACLIRLLKAVKRPKILDLALVGVLPEYLNRGISSAFMSALQEMLLQGDIEYCETNLNMEDNYQIQNQWKHFRNVIHKRRRAFVKQL